MKADNVWGYSPLDRINKRNAKQLQLALFWAMDSKGANETAPLMHDGIVYLPNVGGAQYACVCSGNDLPRADKNKFYMLRDFVA